MAAAAATASAAAIKRLVREGKREAALVRWQRNRLRIKSKSDVSNALIPIIKTHQKKAENEFSFSIDALRSVRTCRIDAEKNGRVSRLLYRRDKVANGPIR